MLKFIRTYLLEIEASDGSTVTVKPPFTLEFDIQRKLLSSANIASIKIFNLSQPTRNKIRKDQYDYYNFKRVTLKAGYKGGQLSVIADGNIGICRSFRDGTNYITEIESYDGGFAYVNGNTSPPPFPAGTPLKSAMTQMIGLLPNVTLGAIGDFSKVLPRGNSYSGKPAEVLNDMSKKGFFIDCGKAYCLNDNEVLAGEPFQISPSTGLLGTPILEQNLLHFDMLFEPQLSIARKVVLQSVTGPIDFNGLYKVISIHHQGTISEAVCGNATTTVGLNWGLKNITEVEPA